MGFTYPDKFTHLNTFVMEVTQRCSDHGGTTVPILKENVELISDYQPIIGAASLALFGRVVSNAIFLVVELCNVVKLLICGLHIQTKPGTSLLFFI